MTRHRRTAENTEERLQKANLRVELERLVTDATASLRECEERLEALRLYNEGEHRQLLARYRADLMRTYFRVDSLVSRLNNVLSLLT